MTPLMRRCSAQAILLSLGLALISPAPLRGQSAIQQPGGSYRIAGRVLNAETGAPLARAEVAILSVVDGMAQDGDQDAAQPRRGRRGRPPSSPSALEAATTAEDGSFAFDHLPAGKYSLRGSHRGFISASYQEHGLYSTAIVAGTGLPSEGLNLKLSPGAVISGSVIDTSGDPLEQAQVSLHRLSDDGLGAIRTFRSDVADDLGAYEFNHLPPGTYFVSAKARVWYASTSSSQAGASGQSGENAAKPVPASATNLDMAYPRTFYADTPDSSAATPIPVRGGEHLRIDLHLEAVPAIHLSYTQPLPNTPGQHNFVRPPVLFQPIFSDRDLANTSATSTDDHGKQTFSISVAPGEYEADVAGRTLSVNATGDAMLDPAAGAAPTEISGRIAAAPGVTLPDSVELILQAVGGGSGGSSTSTATHNGSFHFEQVRPGNYEIGAYAQGQPLAIVEAAANGAQLEGHVLRVGTQTATLAATLAPASALILGYARSSADAPASSSQVDETASGAMIVLVPQHLGDHALYRRDQADSDGSFTLRQIAAGKYTLLAIRDGWDLEWANPQVIAHYLPGGQPVTIASANSGITHLSKPVIVQQR